MRKHPSVSLKISIEQDASKNTEDSNNQAETSSDISSPSNSSLSATNNSQKRTQAISEASNNNETPLGTVQKKRNINNNN